MQGFVHEGKHLVSPDYLFVLLCVGYLNPKITLNTRPEPVKP